MMKCQGLVITTWGLSGDHELALGFDSLPLVGVLFFPSSSRLEPKKCYFEPCLFKVLSIFLCTNQRNYPNLHIKAPAILLIAFCGKFCSFC